MKKTEKTFDKYEYDREYHREHYYRMNIVLTRKEMREELKAAAASEGKSLNKFVLDTLTEKLAEKNNNDCEKHAKKTE